MICNKYSIFAFIFVLDTFEKARKIAEDEYYTSTDDKQLGKGHRKKNPPSRYINIDNDTSSLSDEGDNDNNNKNETNSVNFKCKRKYNDGHTQEHNSNTITESCTSKLPEWPSSAVNSRNDGNIVPLEENIIILENSEYLLHTYMYK